MKTLLSTAVLLIAISAATAQRQNTQSPVQYSPAMYYPRAAALQAHAHYLYLEGDSLEEILEALSGEIDFEDFIADHEWKKLEKEVLVTRTRYKDRNNEDVVEFSSEGLNEAYYYKVTVRGDDEATQLPLASPWVYEYREPTATHKGWLRIFYVLEDFKKGGPDEEMVQYAPAASDAPVVNAGYGQQMPKQQYDREKRLLLWKSVLMVVPLNQILLNVLTLNKPK
jgi:hypothetical protein